MKRIIALIAILLCALGLCIPASARSSAQHMSCDAVVGKDGGCDVTIRATVVFDDTVSDPSFPIPAAATNVSLNGSTVNPSVREQFAMVNLRNITGSGAGTYSLTIAYRLNGAVAAQEDGSMLLTLPLLCSFRYPVDSLTVTVTLPGEITGTPTLISGYYQDNTAGLLDTQVSGSSITISSKQVLLDHETLTMTLPVDEQMFPVTAAAARVLNVMDFAILAVVVLALAYYLLALRPAMPKKILRSTSPDGITAGHIPLWMTGGSVDLSMLVVSWAQLGYLRIQVEKDGRVLLHKRMEMGNERSLFENRCYKNLFGRRLTVDGTGEHYARLVRSVAKGGPRPREVYRPSSGNPYIFRALCALAALLSGISLAGAFAPHSGFLRFLLATMTTVMALAIQSGSRGLVLRNKLPLWIGTGCAILWLVLGICSGEWLVPLLMVLFQFLSGLAAAFGGKRSELGQQALVQILGLRKFMCSVPKQELQRLLNTNPGYFHELIPYALALGVDGIFARRFGRLRLPECSYLICPDRTQMTAAEWADTLRGAVQKLDAKAKRLPIDRLMGK